MDSLTQEFGHLDATGNRTSEQCYGKTTVTYNSDTDTDRLASLSWPADANLCGPSPADVVRPISRDSRGRATSMFRDAFVETPDEYGLRYGVFGRLSGVDVDGDSFDDFEYAYNDYGLRLEKVEIAGSATVRFVYDEKGLLLHESATASHAYVWLGGQLVGVVDAASDVARVGTDHLATPKRAFNSSATLAWNADHEAFGRGQVDASVVDIPFRFPGQYEDSETGLHYNTQRFYDPSSGRYLRLVG